MAVPDLLKDLRLPVIGAPMFIVSGPEMVIEQCKAGIVGAFPSLNARPQSLLDEWLERIVKELDDHKALNPGAVVAPFAVNLIVHHSNPRLEEDLATCIKHRVPIIITSLRALDPAIVESVHEYGGLVFHDVISIRHCEKAAEVGVDGLILVCAGAGGHAGTLSPFALVSELKQWFEGTILLSGAITKGASVLAAQALGADLAYLGTRFIASEEANADPRHKQMLVDCAAKDIVYSSLITGIHGNYLGPSMAEAGLVLNNLPEGDPKQLRYKSGGSNRPKAWKDIWGSGQGLGSIEDVIPVAKIVDRLEAEYRAAWKELQRNVEE
jgi:nitronate monooxygenase